MKKICLVLFGCFLLVGCGNYSGNDAAKDLEKKITNLKGYYLKGDLEITNNDDVYK